MAAVHPQSAQSKPDGWDGVLLGCVIECPGCGAADDYETVPASVVALALLGIASAKGLAGDGVPTAGVILGVAQLHDGTTVRRPTQAMATLRARAAERPEDGATWRRLGNACERYGRPGEAESAWLRAVQVDEREFEAAFSLVQLYEAGGRAEAVRYLLLAVERFPRAPGLAAEPRRGFALALAERLEGLARCVPGPLSLEAAWSDGPARDRVVVRVSSADLHRVRDWERLGEWLASADIAGLRVARTVTDEGDSQLEALLEGRVLEAVAAEPTPSQPFVRVSPKVGRNAPCPCGSGRKHKRCCGRASRAA